jgi:hypothetical protein
VIALRREQEAGSEGKPLREAQSKTTMEHQRPLAVPYCILYLFCPSILFHFISLITRTTTHSVPYTRNSALQHSQHKSAWLQTQHNSVVE